MHRRGLWDDNTTIVGFSTTYEWWGRESDGPVSSCDEEAMEVWARSVRTRIRRRGIEEGEGGGGGEEVMLLRDEIVVSARNSMPRGPQ